MQSEACPETTEVRSEGDGLAKGSCSPPTHCMQAGRGSWIEAEEGDVLYWPHTSVVWRAVGALSLFQNRCLWTWEKTEQLLRKTSPAIISRTVCSLQDKQSSASPLGQGCEDVFWHWLASHVGEQPLGPALLLFWPLGLPASPDRNTPEERHHVSSCSYALGIIAVKSLWLFPLLRNKWKTSACKEF